MSSKLLWILIGGVGVIFVGLVITFGVLAAINYLELAMQPTPTPTLAVPTSAPSSLGGIVWHDLCAVKGSGGGATAEPSSGCVTSPQGGFRANGVLEAGEPGLPGLIVSLGAGACPSTGLTSLGTAGDGTYLFAGLPAGTYCVSMDALATANSSLIPGSWTSPSDAGGTGVAMVTVDVAPGQQRRDVNFGWDYQLLPAPDAAPTSTVPAPTSTPVACLDKAALVQDITMPDDTVVAAGGQFKKTWRLKNEGTCTWSTAYALVFVSGISMGGPASTGLPASVPPGSTVDLSVDLTAPANAGTYQGQWMLRNSRGGLFGIGSNADQPIWVRIVVSKMGEGGPTSWEAEYFTNRELKGSPAVTRTDPVIDFDWKENAPTSGVPADNFSVRWIGSGEFSAGTYRFWVLVDDGARLWVDGILVLDDWRDGSAREVNAEVALAKATHDVRLEYYEHTQQSRVRLRWEKVASPSFEDWKGEYFSNRDLSGTAALVRNDEVLDFYWGYQAPARGLPADNFSARWTRSVSFPTGVYRFRAHADDGIRVYLDGGLLINEWHDSDGSTVYTVDRSLTGDHNLTVEYYEHAEVASAKLWWELIPPTATPTSTTTSTPSATSTPTATSSPTLETTSTETEVPPTETPVTPTDTPTPTPTETPTATPTTTEVAPASGSPSPQAEVVFDFVEKMCDAQWSNGQVTLPCPGTAGDLAGYVVKLSQPPLENGTTSSQAGLITHPQWVADGLIRGYFPVFAIQAGDRFRATIGCMSGQETCDTIFRVGYWAEDEPLQFLGQWRETYDGKLTDIDLSLTALSGQSVSFVIEVAANGTYSGDSTIWVYPRMVR